MTDFSGRQMRQTPLAALCILPANFILLTCRLLKRQVILICPIQNCILGSALFLMEAAMARGASIGARFGGLQDLTIDGETRWLISSVDQSLLELLRRLYTDSLQLEKAGSQAYKRASALFSGEAQRQSLMRLLG